MRNRQPVSGEGGAGDGSGGGGGSGTAERGAKALDAPLCSYGDESSYVSFAFDVMSTSNSSQYTLFNASGSCTGLDIGEVHVDIGDAELGSWSTVCVDFLGAFLSQTNSGGLGVAALSDGARVDSPRFVQSCECPSPLKIHTICGLRDLYGRPMGAPCE